MRVLLLVILWAWPCAAPALPASEPARLAPAPLMAPVMAPVIAPFIVPLVAPVAAPAAAPAAAGAAAGADPARDKAIEALLETAFGEGDADKAAALPGGGRELFATVLAQPCFQHAAAGPFDVYVFQADGLRKVAEAKKVLQRACAGLAPLADLLAGAYPDPGGAAAAGDAAGAGHHLFTGRRFTLVLTSSKGKKEKSFEQIVALLDRCEDQGFSAYKPSLPVWNPEKLAAEMVTTWEVAVFNLAHQAIGGQDKAWFDHGLGYDVALMLTSRMLYRGASGPVPPWLLQGLTDELDIQAYGSAWVAAGESSTWSKATAGWRNAGWEGFVPQGGHPPPPVTGPPANLPSHSFESHVASDSWLERSNSTTRHWAELVADLKSDEPVSLAAMAARQTFSPRDRAWARCVMHVLLGLPETATPGEAHAGGKPVEAGSGESGTPGTADVGPGLLRALDTESQVARSGLQDGMPLPWIFARVLGTHALEEVQARTVAEFLSDITRADLAKVIRDAPAEPLLELKELSAQGEWLYTQPQFEAHTRLTLFLLIQEIENYRELREWELLGIQLDKATRAALGTSKSY
ncbi:MAG TPA: hypothetical protein VK824_01030, partial [Planctomycetota bacterium]|nr:hypothetical protein [Planctomycetota bacterium]